MIDPRIAPIYTHLIKGTVLFVLLLLGAAPLLAQKRQLCITYDDLPVVDYGNHNPIYHKQLTDRLVHTLVKYQIPAIGFVNERKMYKNGKADPAQLKLLESWADHGLQLGNHTFSHPDYNNVSYREFTADILRGEILTRKVLRAKGEELRYFRHPFLHVGATRERADSLDAFLSAHGYTVAPVTIDNEDYLFALAYHRAHLKKDSAMMRRIGTDFITYIEAKLHYYEKQSVALFGREIPQILLLHASLLNSDYAEKLASLFVRNNYIFVGLGKALEEDAYRTPVTVFGKWGISWIDKWALSQGRKGEFFKDDPATPDYIVQMAK